VCALGLLVGTAPTGAQSTQSRLDSARQQAGRAKAAYQRIAEAYAQAEQDLQETQGRITRTQGEISRAEDDLGKLQESLKDRVRQAYRMRGVGFFQFLLEAESFRDFSLRLVTLQQQTLTDEDLILQLRKKRAELDLRQRELDRQRGIFASQKEGYASQGRQLRISLEQANSLVRDLQGQLSREQINALFRVGGSGVRGITIPLDACPVSGPHTVTNSFGAPRGGGTRRHQGNDIMAPMGAPVVATVSGRVTRTGSGGLGGVALYLFGGGTEFYYAHLSNLSVGAGQSVSAGQRLGSNGNTGNASGGPPHVHFEIHPGGGRAIDPYPSLSRVC
jgi:murein DD-endopeptidase MepM/ murein hydrolase activator NlpD